MCPLRYVLVLLSLLVLGITLIVVSDAIFAVIFNLFNL